MMPSVAKTAEFEAIRPIQPKAWHCSAVSKYCPFLLHVYTEHLVGKDKK